jgi:hypothetical protein
LFGGVIRVAAEVGKGKKRIEGMDSELAGIASESRMDVFGRSPRRRKRHG